MALIINIKQGDAPVSAATIQRAKEPTMAARGYPQEMRDDAMFAIMMDPAGAKAQAAIAALQVFNADLAETLALNSFNAQLAAYRTSAARLTRHVLADGRAEIWEDQPTGEFDPETGEPITESIMVSAAIDPLEAMVEQEIRDPETGEVTGTEMIPNPLIEADTAERAAAQAVVDGTPAEVVAYEA